MASEKVIPYGGTRTEKRWRGRERKIKREGEKEGCGGGSKVTTGHSLRKILREGMTGTKRVMYFKEGIKCHICNSELST